MCVCRGVWNVPYITQAYLIRGSILRSKLSPVSLFVDEEMDPDMVFSRTVRDQVTFPLGWATVQTIVDPAGH